MVEIKKEDLTPAQLEKLMNCKTAEELVSMVKELGHEMTLEEAEAYLDERANVESVSEEMSDEELDKVAGGGIYSIYVSATDGCCIVRWNGPRT